MLDKKQLTIVIKNMPPQAYANSWAGAIKKAQQQFGIDVKESDTINIDSEVIAKNGIDMLSELLATAFTCNVMMEVDRIFNE